MTQAEIINKLHDSDNSPCVIVTKDGGHFLAAPQETTDGTLRYGVYDQNAVNFLKSDDRLIAAINSGEIPLDEIFSVISWEELSNYRVWIEKWENYPIK